MHNTKKSNTKDGFTGGKLIQVDDKRGFTGGSLTKIPPPNTSTQTSTNSKTKESTKTGK